MAFFDLNSKYILFLTLSKPFHLHQYLWFVLLKILLHPLYLIFYVIPYSPKLIKICYCQNRSAYVLAYKVSCFLPLSVVRIVHRIVPHPVDKPHMEMDLHCCGKEERNLLINSIWKCSITTSSRIIHIDMYIYIYISNAFFNSASVLLNFFMYWASNVA